MTTSELIAPAAPGVTPQRSGARTSYARRVLSWLWTGVVVVALALALAVAVIPWALGGAALTLLSGSMEPWARAGDMVVVRPVDADDLRLGDVVTFQERSGDPTLVTHRIVGRLGPDDQGRDRLITRGDANGANDPPIVTDQVMGRVMYRVPWVGHLAHGVGDHRPLVVGGVAALLVGYGLLTLARPRRRGPDTASTEPAGPGSRPTDSSRSTT